MHISKISIKNIKSYHKVDFQCNPSFNIIIGENNVGKSTIFDAILLWQMAYRDLITVKGKTFYKKTNWNSMNINFYKLLIFRIVNASNIFNKTTEEASITLSIKAGEDVYDLEIEMDIPNIDDAYIRFKNQTKHNDFVRFAEYCSQNNINLRDVSLINITKPVASIVKTEPFVNRAMITKQSYLGRSSEVLRNKVLLTRENEKFEYLETKLRNVLNKNYKIRYKNKSRDDDEFIFITIEEENNTEIDLALVGSGLLHIIEIFASIYVKDPEEVGFHLLLLDEPDSHIHTDTQVKLIEELRNDTAVQVFLITHNDRLMQKAEAGELFYINETIKSSGILEASSLDEYQIIRQDLASLLPEINDTQTLIITEGKTDWKHFKAALNYFKENDTFINLEIEFLEYDNEIKMGESPLQTLLKELAKVPRTNKIIGIFDSDTTIGTTYLDIAKQKLSDQVYAICIPAPEHRAYHTGISVEFLYQDNDLKKIDQNQRRIYLSDEFSEGGRFLENREIVIGNSNIIKNKTSPELSMVIDSDVIDLNDNNIALTKNNFATMVLNKQDVFSQMDFSGFHPLFEKINEILI